MPPDFYMLSSAVWCSKMSKGPDSLWCQQHSRKILSVEKSHATYLLINCLYLCLETGSKSVQYGLSIRASSIDVFPIFASCPPSELAPPSRVITWLKPSYWTKPYKILLIAIGFSSVWQAYMEIEIRSFLVLIGGLFISSGATVNSREQ